MAAGLPQVANCGVGMAEIIETPGCGLLVDPSSPEAVGKAINRILGDEQLRRKMSENSRAIHLSKFNCEHQFAPILEKVLTWCN
jgi:glycosyltransferase involved in cell wall biosynthesis